MARRNEKKPRRANERAKRSYAVEEERARNEASHAGYEQNYGQYGTARPGSYYPARGRDFGPEEFGREPAPYGGAYGMHGVETRPADYYRNKTGVYGGRPEARGWLPDAATTPIGAHRGRGPKNYKRSDERIREDVNDYLTDDSELDATGIVVEVRNGEVTLNGTVSEKPAKRRAEDLADAVSGVIHVQNNLRVEPSGGALHDVP